LFIKPLSKIAEKWVGNTRQATGAYSDGVKLTPKLWDEETIAATGRYEAGIQQSIADGRFENGVARVGHQKWKSKTLAKGPTRWIQGVGLAEPDYAAGFGPYRAVIESLQLPPRGGAGDPANLDRVRIIAEALHAEKLRIKGGG